GERSGGGRRRDDATRDGCAAGVGECAIRVRVRAARDRAGGVLELVPAENCRHLAGAGMDIYGSSFRGRGGARRRTDQKDLPTRATYFRGARARSRDSGQHLAGVGRIDSADVVADGRRGPSDGSAQSGQPRNLCAQPFGGCEGGRRVISGETSGKIPGQDFEGHARLLSVVAGAQVQLRRPRFAADDDADFAAMLDLDDGALAVEVQLGVAVAAGHFKHAAARVLNARYEDLGRAGRGRIAFEYELESAADTIEFHRARNTLCRSRVRSDEAGERAAAAIDVRRIGLLVAREDTQIF